LFILLSHLTKQNISFIIPVYLFSVKNRI